MQRCEKYSYSSFLPCYLALITWAVDEQFRTERVIWLYVSAQFKIVKKHSQARAQP